MYYCKRMLTLAVSLAVVKQYNSFNSGKKILGPYVVFDGPFGKLQCIKECLLRRRCAVIGYNQRHLRCELGEEQITVSDSDYMAMTAFRADVKQYEYLLGQCANHNCPQRHQCVEYESKYRCIDDACPLAWKQYKNHCYYFSTESMTWDGANDECNKLDSFQVKIDDKAENDWISINKYPYDEIWLGASDKRTEGKWIWEMDNSLLDLNLWHSQQPNNIENNEHCMLMSAVDKWFDRFCYNNKTFICESPYNKT